MMMVMMMMMMKGLSQVKWVRDARSGQTSSGGRQRSAYQQCVQLHDGDMDDHHHHHHHHHHQRSAYQQCVQLHHGDMDQHDQDEDAVDEVVKDGSDDDDDVGDCNCYYDDDD